MAVSVERGSYLDVVFNGKKKEDNLARAERVLTPAFAGAWIGVLGSISSGDMYYMNGFGLIEAGILGELIRQTVIAWKRKANEQRIRI